jgi:hypothetical protein
VKRAAVIAVALLACGKDGGDWTTRKIAPVTATFEGKSFTIDLPEGMRQKADKYEVRWDFLEGEYAKTPEISVSTHAAWKTVDDYAKSESKVTTWVRKETFPDGFIVAHENTTYPGKEDYIVYAVKGDWGCMARVTPWSRGDSVKDKLPAVEQMCLSIKSAK